MALNQIFIGDIGTCFEATIKDVDSEGVETIVPLSTLTFSEYRYKRPDCTYITRTPVVFGDPNNGVLRYISVADDLSQHGEWILQARIQLATGDWHTTTFKFTVHPLI